MILRKRFLSFLIVVLSLSFAASSYSSSPTMTLNNQYYIENVRVDLAQCCVFGLYLSEAQFTRLVQETIEYKLKEAGVTLASQPAEGAISLDFRLDYRRNFVGDGTPFPIRNLRTPDYYFYLTASQGDQSVYSFESRKLTQNPIAVSGAGLSKEQEKDYGHGINVGALMAKQLISVIDGASFNKKVLAGEYIPIVESVQSAVASDAAGSQDYIPESVIAGYLRVLEGSDQDARTDAYQEIRRGWFNSSRLFSAIAANIESGYKAQDRSDIKEIREAMNALASSGDEAYSALFEKIDADEAASRKVRAEASDSMKILQKRAALAGAVHDTATMDASQPWYINQLANRARSPDPKTAVYALKEIYRDYRDNPYLLTALATMLENEAMVNSYKSGAKTDVYAWAIRIVGLSGDAQYLELLKTLENDSPFDKVEDYAEEYYDELEDLVEDQAS